MRARIRRSILPQAAIVVLFVIAACGIAHAQGPPVIPKLPQEMTGPAEPQDFVLALRIVIGLALLSLAPSLLMMVTSFTRIVIILGFLRQALGTQQTPPNAVLIGLALFLTFFIMQPVWSAINQQALGPYMRGEIQYKEALASAGRPLKSFMLGQTREKDLVLFLNLAKMKAPAAAQELPFHVVMPAFVISELKSAFQIAFVIYIPFVIIDLIVASALMSMGMFMLPPVMISLPFKILLFVMIDGWYLIIESVVVSFQ